MVTSFFLILHLVSFSCLAHINEVSYSNSIKSTGYDLSRPEIIYILPDILNEISGITETDATSIACIQDENGILFFYDLVKGQIKKQYTFYTDGDYEGIARVDNSIFILRSEGTLIEISNYESAIFKRSIHTTGLIIKDNEGLCFDQNANRLLIAPKGNIIVKPDDKDKRVIYSFDLRSKRLLDKPAFIFDLKEIKKFALDNNIKVPMNNPKKGEKKKPIIEFIPSAIGIQPYTNKLFVISGIERLLFVFNMNGKIEFMEKLDPDFFNQPEGITFLKNGDLLISNEGHNKKPTIVRFNYLEE